MALAAAAVGHLVERRPVRAPHGDRVEVLELHGGGAETRARRQAEARLERAEQRAVIEALGDAGRVGEVGAADALAVARPPAAEAADARVAHSALGGAGGRVAVVNHLEHLPLGQQVRIDPLHLVHIAELRVVLDDHAAVVNAPQVREGQLGRVRVRHLHRIRHVDRGA